MYTRYLRAQIRPTYAHTSVTIILYYTLLYVHVAVGLENCEMCEWLWAESVFPCTTLNRCCYYYYNIVVVRMVKVKLRVAYRVRAYIFLVISRLFLMLMTDFKSE